MPSGQVATIEYRLEPFGNLGSQKTGEQKQDSS